MWALRIFADVDCRSPLRGKPTLSSSGIDCCSVGPLCEKCQAKANPWNTIGANLGLPSSEGDDLGWCALVVVVTTAAADGDRLPLSALAVAMAMAWVAVVVSAA